ncbi:MAG: hypothetical protein ABF532_09330 [Bifidobacterium sp.]|jgi:hypothetical protein|uniref:hypothetical protein n=1 Tax=Bifidobacterium sp. TaxID=41200 RepID=UPI0039EA16F2
MILRIVLIVVLAVFVLGALLKAYRGRDSGYDGPAGHAQLWLLFGLLLDLALVSGFPLLFNWLAGGAR